MWISRLEWSTILANNFRIHLKIISLAQIPLGQQHIFTE